MISIVMPTLNEEQSLPRLLDALRGEKADHEVIVVDGGSEDRTAEIAHARGVRVVLPRQCPAFSGEVMNSNARTSVNPCRLTFVGGVGGLHEKAA